MSSLEYKFGPLVGMDPMYGKFDELHQMVCIGDFRFVPELLDANKLQVFHKYGDLKFSLIDYCAMNAGNDFFPEVYNKEDTNYITVATLLLDAGSEFDNSDNRENTPAICFAAAACHPELVHLLASRGALVTDQTVLYLLCGWSMFGIMEGHKVINDTLPDRLLATITVMHEFGADLDYQHVNVNSLMNQAILKNNVDVVRLLCELGASTEMKTNVKLSDGERLESISALELATFAPSCDSTLLIRVMVQELGFYVSDKMHKALREIVTGPPGNKGNKQPNDPRITTLDMLRSCCQGRGHPTICGATPSKDDKRCGGCRSVFYCCVEHAKKDWKQHRTTCQKIQRLKKIRQASIDSNNNKKKTPKKKKSKKKKNRR